MFNSILGDTVTVWDFSVCMIAAIILGICSAFVFTYKSRHSASFTLALALLPMTVAMVIILVNGNLGTGIAVAGAFTLVRFRSVPGTAKEISAIFVDMAMGLAIGMGYVCIAAVFFVMAALLCIVLTIFSFGFTVHNEKQLKITIPENYNYEGLFDGIFERFTKSVKLDKVRTTNMGTLFELTYSVVFPTETIPKEFLDELRTRNGNLNITIGTVADAEIL